MRKLIALCIVFLLYTTCAYATTVRQLQSKYRDDPIGLSKYMQKSIDWRHDYDNKADTPARVLVRRYGNCVDMAIFARAILGKGRLVRQNKKHVILIFNHNGERYYFTNQYCRKITKNSFNNSHMKKYTPTYRTATKKKAYRARVHTASFQIDRFGIQPTACN